MNPTHPLPPPETAGPIPYLGGEFQSDAGQGIFPARRVTLGRPQQLLEVACRVAQASWGGVGLLSSEGDLVEHLSHGVGEEAMAELLHSPWTAELVRFAARRPGATYQRDLVGELPWLGTPPPSLSVGPFLGVPLNFPARCRGVLYVCRQRGAPPFGPADEEVLQPICTWLDHGRLHEEAHFHAQLQLLNRVAQSAAGSLDLKCILASTLRELDRHLPLYVCGVWLLEEENGESAEPDRPRPTFLYLVEVNPASRDRARVLGLTPGTRHRLEDTPFVSCVRDGQAFYADVASTAAGRADESGRPEGPVCFAIPLRGGDRVVGVLQCLRARPASFVRDHIQLLYLVADLLGPAISNSQLFGRLQNAYEKLHLTQAQLIQAEKMRALGEMAGGMAHEFNNSLCGVLGFLDLLLLNRGLDPTSRSYLQSARTCALDATETVRRVQDFARRQRDGLTVKVLDLDELVRQTLELVRHKWEGLGHARGAPIVVELHLGAGCRIAGSPTELREVVTNLVFNAVDAMPSGGTLTVRTWARDGSGFLAVQDSGIGIPASIRYRLFEPFFTTKGERGNGLGLSVVFGIVRRHEGEITVESAEGCGSTFTVRLPQVPLDFRSEEETDLPPAALSAPAGLRVLVIEDDEFVRDFLDKGLTALGHHPRLATTGPEGLAAFAEENFHVVLTDLGLPGLSGEDVAAQVNLQSPNTPVIVLTGWADHQRAEKATCPGVAAVLGKPISLEALAAALAGICPARS